MQTRLQAYGQGLAMGVILCLFGYMANQTGAWWMWALLVLNVLTVFVQAFAALARDYEATR